MQFGALTVIGAVTLARSITVPEVVIVPPPRFVSDPMDTWYPVFASVRLVAAIKPVRGGGGTAPRATVAETDIGQTAKTRAPAGSSVTVNVPDVDTTSAPKSM